MEHGIIHAGAVWYEGRAGSHHRRFPAHAPPVILIPIGAVGSADIDHAALIFGAQPGFSETDSGVESAGQAAVSHHHGVFVVVLQRIDIGDGERGIRPAGVAAVGGIIHIAHPVGDIGDDLGSGRTGGGIEVGVGSDAMGGIEIVVGAIVDLPIGMGGGIIAVHSCDHHHFGKVGIVGHGIHFVHQGLVHLIGYLGRSGNREAPEIHFWHEIGALQPHIGQIGNMAAGGAVIGRNLGHITHDEQIGRGGILGGCGIPQALHIGFDAVGGGSGLGSGGQDHVETLAGLPLHKGLQGGYKFCRSDDHIAHGIAVEGDAGAFRIEQHPAVDALKGRGIGACPQILSGGMIGAHKADIHLGAVDHFDHTSAGIVSQRNEIQREQPCSAHITDLLHADTLIAGPVAPIVEIAVNHVGHGGGIGAFGDRFLAGGKGIVDPGFLQGKAFPQGVTEAGNHLGAHRDADDLAQQGQARQSFLVGEGSVLHPKVGENTFRGLDLIEIQLLDIVSDAQSILTAAQKLHRSGRGTEPYRSRGGGKHHRCHE